MKKLVMFMLLIFGVLFTANAVTEKPPVKDVGFECSINVEAQNYDVEQMIQQTQIILYEATDVNLQSEGLQNLKYPSMDNYSIINLFPVENINKTSDLTILKVLKYPLLC